MTKEQKLEKIDDAIARWISRGYRAQNAINKLTKQRKRLVKAPAGRSGRGNGGDSPAIVQVAPPAPSEIPLPELDAFFLPTQPLPLKHHDDLAAMPSNQHDDLTIPPDLRRTTAPGKPGPKLLSDMINKPFIDARKKKRLEKMDEKRRGRSMFGKSDMPLTGKDALKAIRAKKA